MPVTERYRPDPRYLGLGAGFADPVPPARFPKHVLRFRNQRHAYTVGLEGLDAGEWEAAFARFEPLPSNLLEPLALRYHGHQFMSYNPRLGDGRGFLAAQVRDERGRLLDLGTKGSGTTPYSRGGDGRLTLKGGVREILATELLEALGVDTSKTFSLYETGEQLFRGDEPSPTRSSVLVRLSHSHLRFGSFQRLAYLKDHEGLARLLAYAIAEYHPGATGPKEFLERVCARVATTCGRWLAAGFVHGVLNTDNMNITGESFDYGPWRFLPEADPYFTAAYFDETGLYAYGRQAAVVRWNLEQLAHALAPLGESLDGALDGYQAAVYEGLRGGVLRRLGLLSGGEAADTALLQAWLGWLEATRVPLDQAYFDNYGGPAGEGRRARSPIAAAYTDARFVVIRDMFESFAPAHPGRLDAPYLRRDRPIENRIETVEALWEAIDRRDDWGPLERHVEGIRTLGALLSPHLDMPVLEAGLRALLPPPRDQGRVELVVQRQRGERRQLPTRARLTQAEGVVGDRWSLSSTPNPEAQVTVMRADVARLMARDGDIARFGDNLFVDLDLSESNLPPGTEVTVGTARCVVTPKPHTGCAKFDARAGPDAREMTRAGQWAELRLRGIHLRVLEDGEVGPGDAIVVTRRG